MGRKLRGLDRGFPAVTGTTELIGAKRVRTAARRETVAAGGFHAVCSAGIKKAFQNDTTTRPFSRSAR